MVHFISDDEQWQNRKQESSIKLNHHLKTNIAIYALDEFSKLAIHSEKM